MCKRRVRRAHQHAANGMIVDTRGAHGAPYQFSQRFEVFVIATSGSGRGNLARLPQKSRDCFAVLAMTRWCCL